MKLKSLYVNGPKCICRKILSFNKLKCVQFESNWVNCCSIDCGTDNISYLRLFEYFPGKHIAYLVNLLDLLYVWNLRHFIIMCMHGLVWSVLSWAMYSLSQVVRMCVQCVSWRLIFAYHVTFSELYSLHTVNVNN